MSLTIEGAYHNDSYSCFVLKKLLKLLRITCEIFVIEEIENMQIQCFKDLPLSREVLSGIEELGFSSLFPIQAQAIVPPLEGKDVIGKAHTGTGKTATFGIPMVDR